MAKMSTSMYVHLYGKQSVSTLLTPDRKAACVSVHSTHGDMNVYVDADQAEQMAAAFLLASDMIRNAGRPDSAPTTEEDWDCDSGGVPSAVAKLRMFPKEG